MERQFFNHTEQLATVPLGYVPHTHESAATLLSSQTWHMAGENISVLWIVQLT